MPNIQLLSNPDFGLQVTGTTRAINVTIYNYEADDCIATDITVDTSLGYTIPTIPPYVIPGYDFVVLVIYWTAGAVGVTPASNLTITSNDPNSPLVAPVTSASVANGKVIAVDPGSWVFDNTKVGVDSAIKVFAIDNLGGTNVIVSGITFPTGWAAAAPIPVYPLTVTTPSGVQYFGAKFNPVDEGYVTGNITIASDATAGDFLVPVSGNGFLITPAYIAEGVEALFFGFGDASVKLMDPTDFECEVSAYCINTIMLPFQTPQGAVPGFSYEKEAVRVLFHYEDLGIATLRIRVTTMRGQTVYQDVVIGTVTADEKLYQGIADIVITDEVHILKFEAISGPIQLVDWVAQYVMKGERKK